MKWFSVIAALFGCGPLAKKVSEAKSVSGPFEIRWEVYSSRSNKDSNADSAQLTSYFSVYYKGKIIEIPQKEEKADFFWQALFLKDAGRPAVLVATHSAYLITEENGAPKITPVHLQDGDFAYLQWLDSNHGQPGEIERVYLGDHSRQERFLHGGRYLMVNKSTVLDIQTLKIFPVEVNTYERVQALDKYHAGGSEVLQISPSGIQLVLIGDRSRPGNNLFYDYALVVINFKTNEAYAVPFDQTDFRFFSVWDATPGWINTYFEWSKTQHEERLVKRKLNKLPYWHGWYSTDVFSGKVTEYILRPVNESMIGAYLGFLAQDHTITEVRKEDKPDFGTKSVYLKADGQPLFIYYQQKEKSLSVNRGAENVDVEPFGKEFDAAMAKGMFQEHYDRFD